MSDIDFKKIFPYVVALCHPKETFVLLHSWPSIINNGLPNSWKMVCLMQGGDLIVRMVCNGFSVVL